MSTRRPRILHLMQNLNYGGMERVLADLFHGLHPRFELHLLVLQYLGRFSEGLDDVATLHKAPPLSRWSMLFPGPLTAVIASIGPDLVHTHSGVWFKGSLAARHAGVRRVVHTEHGRKNPDPWSDRVVDRGASRRTDVAVAVSPTLGDHLRRRVVSPGCQVEVISNGIDTERYRPRPDPGAIRLELGLAPGAPILLSIGRLERIKGYEVMVRAYARLRTEWTGSDVPALVVGGDGSERDALLAMARELGVAEGIHLLGWRDDTLDLLAAGTLFTLSSWSEGTSISLLEAMSSGLCPVVTDVGGNAAVLGEGLQHRLVPAGSPEALAGAWRQALLSPDELAADAARARARVVDRFAMGRMVEDYVRLYQRLLA